MKFLCKALSLALLLSVSAKAAVFDMHTLVPLGAAAAVGEYMHHVKKDATRTPEKKSPMMRTATELAEAAAGSVVISAVKQERMTLEATMLNAVTAYLALTLTRSKTINDLLSNIPVVRGLLCDDCTDEMTRQNVTKLTVSATVVDYLVKRVREMMPSVKADVTASVATTPSSTTK